MSGEREILSVNPNTEVRKIPIGLRLRISSILEANEAWKVLMGCIPVAVGTLEPKKYSSEHVRIIEEEAKRQKKHAFDILVDEWGTSGKQRPKISDLVQLLASVELYQAADCLSEELKMSPVQRPSMGPSAIIVPNHENLQTTHMLQTMEDLGNSTVMEARNDFLNPSLCQSTLSNNTRGLEDFELSNNGLPHLTYNELEHITNNFDANPVSHGGRKLGAGAFGTVFLGKFKKICSIQVPVHSQVAVKRLHNQKGDFEIDVKRLFRTEVEIMSQYQHENLLTLLAYSANGPDCCLVYSYMPNGSLEDRLACKEGYSALQWNQRLDVAHGVAKALIHLHTSGEQPLVHRDVKSANILLDHDMKPKLGDFGLVRISASGRGSKSIALTSNVLGTSAYMAPEAFRGDVSVKLDTFSFGVVILELLTGLPPYDEDRDGNDLISHIDAALDGKVIIQLLDSRIPPLPESMVSALHSIALDCIKEKKHRPFMNEVYDRLLLVDHDNLPLKS